MIQRYLWIYLESNSEWGHCRSLVFAVVVLFFVVGWCFVVLHIVFLVVRGSVMPNPFPFSKKMLTFQDQVHKRANCICKPPGWLLQTRL
jgi:hypothetical protein